MEQNITRICPINNGGCRREWCVEHLSEPPQCEEIIEILAKSFVVFEKSIELLGELLVSPDEETASLKDRVRGQIASYASSELKVDRELFRLILNIRIEELKNQSDLE